MRVISNLGRLALVSAGAALLAWPAAARPADKVITEVCSKDPRTGGYTYDMAHVSEDYIITVTHFRETSRDAQGVHGVCTIKLKYQPAD
jgi:hypothetical protein